MWQPRRAVSRSLAELPGEASRGWAGDADRPGMRLRGFAAGAVPVTWGAESSETPFELGRLGTITACQGCGHPLGGLGGTVGETRVPADTKAPCLSERRAAETAEPPRRSRTATGTHSSPCGQSLGAALVVRAWEREHTLDAHDGKKSPAGPCAEPVPRSRLSAREKRLAKPGKIVWPWRSAPGGYCAPCQKEQSPAEIAELPGRSRTATGRKFSALRSMPGRRRTSRTLMTARQSRAGTLTRTRCSAAAERAPRGCGTAGETRKDHPA